MGCCCSKQDENSDLSEQLLNSSDVPADRCGVVCFLFVFLRAFSSAVLCGAPLLSQKTASTLYICIAQLFFVVAAVLCSSGSL